MFLKNFISLMLACLLDKYIVWKLALFLVWFERQANLHKNWSMQTLFYRVFWILLPNIKIDDYNFELYRFKVSAFLRHSVDHGKYVKMSARTASSLVKSSELLLGPHDARRVGDWLWTARSSRWSGTDTCLPTMCVCVYIYIYIYVPYI